MNEQNDLLEDDNNTAETSTDVSSPLNLSDDELANFDFAALAQPTAPVIEAAATAEGADGANAGVDAPAGNTDTPAGDDLDDEDYDEAGEGADDAGEAAQAKPAAKPEPAADAAKPADTDYEAIAKKLFAPFKANGKDMQVTSVDDAIALMQMGANYNKKMAALKPNLKLMKLLENNGLLNDEKLGYLIDLNRKNPQAIMKLVKDSGLDPLDMDVSKESEYKPQTYTVDDRDIALDEVIEQIQDTSTYAQTLNIVSNKWDGPSKRVVADNPQLLRVINDHLANGIYDVISSEMERERMFGRLNGMSDIEAYKLVGDTIEARGGFAHLFPKQGQQSPAPTTVVAPKPKAEDPALRNKKRAASSTKATAPAPAKSDFNPLALSDDEFSKQFNSRLL